MWKDKSAFNNGDSFKNTFVLMINIILHWDL